MNPRITALVMIDELISNVRETEPEKSANEIVGKLIASAEIIMNNLSLSYKLENKPQTSLTTEEIAALKRPNAYGYSKIPAIKMLRERTDFSLEKALHIVEQYMYDNGMHGGKDHREE